MGSPVSAVVANFVHGVLRGAGSGVSSLETKVWKLYVDDTCCIMRRDEVEHLVETSASCTPNIKLSTKNLRCFYTVLVLVIVLHHIIMV